MKREDFARPAKRRTTTFPFRDGSVSGVAPTVAELRKWRQSYQNADGSLNLAKAMKADEALLALVLRDEDWQPLLSMDEAYEGFFDGHEADEINALCTRVSVFVGIDPSEMRDIRDAAKNSKGTATSESCGNSPPDKAEP